MEKAEKPKKQHILENAAVLFRDKGYSATSMRDLARSVGLQASSLYNHIESKEKLLQEICLANALKFLSMMEKVEAMDIPVAEKVEQLLRLHIRTAIQDVTSVTSFNDEWRHLGEPYLSDFKEMRRDYEQRFIHILRQGIEAGEIRAQEPQIVLYTLFSSLRWLYDWFQPGKRLSATDVEEEILNLLFYGLRCSSELDSENV
ncbi:MAG: TetR family transcriptional regulator [Haliscomenobacter sp.]|nr:TetR family transcriptional regulator [Haliscomenobacter sp.]MBK8879590.1 TetR family transcriptional regulator [Haliscomenobacter sp.]